MVAVCEAEHQRDRWMTSTLCVRRTPDVSNIRYRSNLSCHLEGREKESMSLAVNRNRRNDEKSKEGN